MQQDQPGININTISVVSNSETNQIVDKPPPAPPKSPQTKILIVTVVGLTFLALAIMGFVLFSAISNNPGLKACTAEAKLCPDGKTTVSRSGPNCQFAACPPPVTSQ